MAETRTVSYAETIAIRGFLSYLQKNYSRLINPNDVYTIAAVSAWLHVTSGGGLSKVVFNNPFRLRGAPGPRRADGSPTPGPLLRYATLAQGFIAAAKVLMKATTANGFLLALNALKRGGNEAAVDFLAAMAMSRWDAGHYGAADWLAAFDATKNKLLAAYTKIGGVQLKNPYVKPVKPAKPASKLPRDYNFQPVKITYLDPWAAGMLYKARRRRTMDISAGRR
jgi:hypothetical protein